ncbi:MAG: phage major capsid protein [Solibacillus sp.]
MRLKEIETRLAEIKKELTGEGAAEKSAEELDKLEAEVRSLQDERTGILKAIEKRAAIEKAIANGEVTGVDITPDLFNGGKKEMQERTFDIASAEYRGAWLNNIRGIELNDVEKRALTTAAASAGAAVPTATVNKIIDKVKEFCPIINKIELLHVKGSVSIPAEGTTADAQKHAEGATITADADTLVKVTLAGYEITKLVTVSKSVVTMSIDAFEAWLVNKIARKVAEKIGALIFNGSGTGEAQGVNAITWNEKNSITVAKAAALTEANVTGVVALMNGGYFANAEWYMSSSTFFADFYPLMNNSKNNVVTETNGVYRIMGKAVNFDERVTAHEAFLGDFYRGYIGNLQEDVNVTSQFVARENAFDFLGCAIFDGKVQAVEAFVKIAKATA